MKKSPLLKIDLNIKDDNDNTAFHLACRNGYSEIAEMIIKTSTELKIDLNGKDNNVWTAYEIAKMMIKKSQKEPKIDWHELSPIFWP